MDQKIGLMNGEVGKETERPHGALCSIYISLDTEAKMRTAPLGKKERQAWWVH